MSVAADRLTGAERRARLERARLYFVCEARPGGRNADSLLRAALAGGVDMVQLRDKELDDDGILAAAEPFREICRSHESLFVLNDRPDLAARCSADGVHLGQEDISVADARRAVGPDALIGLSTHSLDQIEAAEGVDYISVGPVFETPTKPGREAVGLELVEIAEQLATVPFFAIGGIDPSNAGRVIAAGGQRLVVVRAIRDAEHPRGAAQALRTAAEAHESI